MLSDAGILGSAVARNLAVVTSHFDFSPYGGSPFINRSTDPLLVATPRTLSSSAMAW